MNHYLYILYSRGHDKYYVGETVDFVLRLKQHNSSARNTFTSKYRPWELVALFEAEDRHYIKKCERFIKLQKSKVFVKKLIEPCELNGIDPPDPC